MQPSNLLFILSDEHQRDIAGCYGDRIAITPNIDALAARGARFTNAYTPCPDLRPGARRARNWPLGASDEVVGQCGALSRRAAELAPPAARQRAPGRLHRQAAFPRDRRRQRLQRGDPPAARARRQRRSHRHAARAAGRSAAACRRSPRAPGPGKSTYNDYDRDITAAACRWIAERRTGKSDKPWVLFVSLVRPHFPLTAPPEFFALYPPERMPMPRLYDEAGRPRHPAVSALRVGHELRRLFRRRARRSGARSPPTMRSSASSTTTSARSSRPSKQPG